MIVIFFFFFSLLLLLFLLFQGRHGRPDRAAGRHRGPQGRPVMMNNNNNNATTTSTTTTTTTATTAAAAAAATATTTTTTTTDDDDDDDDDDTHTHSSQELPIYAHREHILQHVRDNRITHIQGETGCGKSTQAVILLIYYNITYYTIV